MCLQRGMSCTFYVYVTVTLVFQGLVLDLLNFLNSRDLLFSVMLHSIDWQFVTDVSGQP